MKSRAIVSSLVVVLSASLVWADGDHAAHAPKMAAPFWVWAVGLGALILIVLVLIRQARRGTLPFLFAALFDIGPESAWARRAALMCGLPIMLFSMIPIYLIREEWKPMNIRRWVEGIENYGRIGVLALTEGLIGLGLGFSAPFFNIFFDQHLKASTAQIGLIFAVAFILYYLYFVRIDGREPVLQPATAS